MWDTDTVSSGDLTHQERLDYVNAVLCLQHLPPRTPANVSAGARSRVCAAQEHTMIKSPGALANVYRSVRRLHCHPYPADAADSLHWQLLALASVCNWEETTQQTVSNNELIVIPRSPGGSRTPTKRHCVTSADTKATSP